MTGSELRKAREFKRLTQGELSKLTGYPPAFLKRWEKDGVPASAAETLKKALDIHPRESRCLYKPCKTSSGARFAGGKNAKSYH